jgi:hypothetical protein
MGQISTQLAGKPRKCLSPYAGKDNLHGVIPGSVRRLTPYHSTSTRSLGKAWPGTR